MDEGSRSDKWKTYEVLFRIEAIFRSSTVIIHCSVLLLFVLAKPLHYFHIWVVFILSRIQETVILADASREYTKLNFSI